MAVLMRGGGYRGDSSVWREAGWQLHTVTHLWLPVLTPGSFRPPAPPPQLFFPQIFDIKYLMKFCDNLHGGLNKLAETLDVVRIGPQHQVGRRSGATGGWGL